MLKHPILLIKVSLLLFTLNFTFLVTLAQEGHYITPYYVFQYTNIVNYNDYRNPNLYFKDTYNSAYGINYSFNSTHIFGFETGIKYSEQGQKYSGQYKVTIDTNQIETREYKSELHSSYIQIPVLLRLNSSLHNSGADDDFVYMTLSFGFQIDILYDVKMDVDPYPIIEDKNSIDLKELYKKSNTSFLGNAILNIHIFDHWYLFFGTQLSRTIGNIDNKNFDLLENDEYPLEYFFPVSTKKSTFPEDFYIRQNSRNMVWGFMGGISYKI